MTLTSVNAANMYVSVSGTDISSFCDTCDLTRGVDEVDITTMGQTGHVVGGTLTNGSVKLGGVYSTGTSGTPRVLFESLGASAAAVVHRPEGTGSSKPERTFNALFTEYAESFPVADKVRWTASGTISGAVTTTSQ